MKTKIRIGIALAVLATSLTHSAIGQEYTYLLTVTSLGEEEQTFDLKIKSTLGLSSDSISMVLSNQTTPFERKLETGEHVIIVEQEAKGGVLSKVTGIVDGAHMGWASADDQKTVLKAGPGGRYASGLKLK